MKIIFIGTVKFSYDALKCVLDEGGEVVAVVTQKSDAINSDFVDMTPLCKTHKIPFFETDNINSSTTLNWIRQFSSDIIFCFGWSQLIKAELLSIPPMGVVGFHPAELPKNRGRHPLIWALILDRLKTTASTFFLMDEGADSGDIISQEKVPIYYEDRAMDLYNRVTETALNQIREFLPQLKQNNFKRRVQDHSVANTWRKRTKKDGVIDFRMPSRAVYNLIRALSHPYVGAHVEYNNQDIKVWDSREMTGGHDNIEPGKVIDITDNGIVVKCYDNAIWLDSSEFTPLPSIGDYL